MTASEGMIIASEGMIIASEGMIIKNIQNNHRMVKTIADAK
ncbi:hypothetical protein [Methanoplanus limicola]|nr:hypothetical protein [Methanoplanus limicola]